MSIIKKNVWTAKCDRCRKKFGEGAMFPFAESKKKLLEALDEALWEIRFGQVLCDECSFKVNEELEKQEKDNQQEIPSRP